jgi:hypothetical protein
MRTLFLTGSLTAVVAAVGLFSAIYHDLGLGTRVALYSIAFNVVAIFAKFVLAPRGVYEVNRTTPIESWVNFTSWQGAIAAAVLVFALYGVALGLIYSVFRRRLVAAGQLEPRRRRIVARRTVVYAAVGGIGLAAFGGAFIILLPLIVVGSGFEYVDFVFSSSISALALAAGIAIAAFKSVTERADVVADASLLVTFFWVALYFLAMYHALWVVYIIVLTTTWPLKVVIPK